jgi:hypothetical protein
LHAACPKDLRPGPPLGGDRALCGGHFVLFWTALQDMQIQMQAQAPAALALIDAG